MKTLKTLKPEDLVDMTPLSLTRLARIDLAYARSDNALFGERIYREEARLWLYAPLAEAVQYAAELLQDQGYRLVLYDGLRTMEAQEKMLETRRVKDNPQWLEEPRLLSPPGAGAHPRGMAIDCSLETLAGDMPDMGTLFDFLAADPSPAKNPAHREHPMLSDAVRNHRSLLNEALIFGAGQAGIELDLLPQEWWDFRLPKAFYETYTPLRDSDLPAPMRMLS